MGSERQNSIIVFEKIMKTLNIIFTTDFIMHDFSNRPTYHAWLFNLLKKQIHYVYSQCTLRELKHCTVNGEVFSRDTFLSLSGIQDASLSYFIYKTEDISPQSIKYLKQFLPENTLIFGFELTLSFRKILTNLDINYINYAIHPFKLAPDVMFLCSTNNSNIHNVLLKNQTQSSFFAENVEKFIRKSHKEIKQINSKITKPTLLLIGQIPQDQSTADLSSNKYLSLLDYQSKILQLCKEYSQTYYKPHPHAREIPQDLLNFLAQHNIEVVRHNTYHMLASQNIKHVVAISSSVVHEATFFGKCSSYLYQPLFDVDAQQYSINSFISHFKEHLSALYWVDVLKAIGFSQKKSIYQKVVSYFNEYKIIHVFIRRKFNITWKQ
jgi:hypothetical protein